MLQFAMLLGSDDKPLS